MDPTVTKTTPSADVNRVVQVEAEWGGGLGHIKACLRVFHWPPVARSGPVRPGLALFGSVLTLLLSLAGYNSPHSVVSQRAALFMQPL